MAAVEEVAPGLGTASACRSLGLPRASLYRMRPPAAAEASRPRPAPPRALSAGERQAVLDTLHSERFLDQPPAEVQAALLDEGTYLCSTRTMYRILDSVQEVKERRDQVRRPHYVKPELLATGPNQVWSWDITKLLGPAKWTYFYLYVILDIFSRYVVGWMVAHHESAALAEGLIAETYGKQEITKGQLTIHADRGTSMKSKPVALLLADLGVVKTHSRPQVSNDNPFSESQFKTLKYRPDFPERFGSIEHARSFGRGFFSWYNDEHHHSALGFLTPAVVHYGRGQDVREKRRQVLAAAHAAHPERFVKGTPRPAELPAAVWINPPAKNATHQDAPGSTQTNRDDLRVDPVCITYVTSAPPDPLPGVGAAPPELLMTARPQPAEPLAAVLINPPAKNETHQDAPGSTPADPDDLKVDPVCITYQPSAPTAPLLTIVGLIVERTGH